MGAASCRAAATNAHQEDHQVAVPGSVAQRVVIAEVRVLNQAAFTPKPRASLLHGRASQLKAVRLRGLDRIRLVWLPSKTHPKPTPVRHPATPPHHAHSNPPQHLYLVVGAPQCGSKVYCPEIVAKFVGTCSSSCDGPAGGSTETPSLYS